MVDAGDGPQKRLSTNVNGSRTITQPPPRTWNVFRLCRSWVGREIITLNSFIIIHRVSRVPCTMPQGPLGKQAQNLFRLWGRETENTPREKVHVTYPEPGPPASSESEKKPFPTRPMLPQFFGWSKTAMYLPRTSPRPRLIIDSCAAIRVPATRPRLVRWCDISPASSATQSCCSWSYWQFEGLPLDKNYNSSRPLACSTTSSEPDRFGVSDEALHC